MFGRQIPKDVLESKGKPVRCWGARAIFTDGTVDLLANRQGYTGPDHDTEKDYPKSQRSPYEVNKTGSSPKFHCEQRKYTRSSEK